MTKTVSNYAPIDAHSAHWNQRQAVELHARVQTSSSHQKAPAYLSAPDFDPNTLEIPQPGQVDLSKALGAVRQLSTRFANALPWLIHKNSAGTRALAQAASMSGAPGHLRQALTDAQDIHTTGVAVKTQLSASVRASAQQWRQDPLGEVRQLAWLHAQTQRDAGYALAQKADEIFHNPALLLEPVALAGFALGSTITSRVLPFRGKTLSNSGDVTRTHESQLKYTYRSQPPLKSSTYDIDTKLGPITAGTTPGKQHDFSLSINRAERRPQQSLVRTHISGRNEGNGQLRILTFSTDESEPRRLQTSDLVAGLAWAATGPGHSAPTQRISIPVHRYSLGIAEDVKAFQQRQDPTTMAITQLLADALEHFGIDIANIAYGTDPNHAYGRPSELVYTTRPNRRFDPAKHPQLGPKLPSNVRLTSIAPMNSVSRATVSGGLHPTTRLEDINIHLLEDALRRTQRYGVDPLNPVVVTRAYGRDRRTHFVPVNDEANKDIWALRLSAKRGQPAPVTPTRTTASITEDRRRTLIERAWNANDTELFTGP